MITQFAWTRRADASGPNLARSGNSNGYTTDGVARSALFRRDGRPRLLKRRSLFKRILVRSQRGRVVGLRDVVTGRQFSFEQSGALKLIEAGQIADRVEPELDQELGWSCRR